MKQMNTWFPDVQFQSRSSSQSGIIFIRYTANYYFKYIFAAIFQLMMRRESGLSSEKAGTMTWKNSPEANCIW